MIFGKDTYIRKLRAKWLQPFSLGHIAFFFISGFSLM
jgi:hypothetical protein